MSRIRSLAAHALRVLLRGRTRTITERTLVRLGHRFPRMRGRGVIAEELMRLHAGERVVARLFDGSRLVVPATREAFATYVHGRCFEEDTGLTRLLLRSLGPGDVFFDVGANIGYYTVLAAGRGARVHAFEAQPALVVDLRSSVELNGFTGVSVTHAAVSNRNGGEEVLFLPPGGDTLLGVASLLRHEWLRGGREVRVPVITLDAYLRERAIERVDVVKIDVEGAEPLVLQGMGELLRRCVPRLVILESWPETLSFDSITPGAAMYAGGPARFAAAAALLEECGFRPRAIGNDGAVNETFSPGALANVAFIR